MSDPGIEALRALTVTDELTRVANRRGFDELLAGAWAHGAQLARPLALIMIDVDYFKAYNDAYGHVDGDGCLQAIAAAFASALKRPGDRLARYGGEEFAAVLPETDAAGAAAVAEAMRAALAALAMPHRASSIGCVSASFGVAALVPDAAHEPADLVRAADAALYEAKAGGRNRVAGGGALAPAPPARRHSPTAHNLPATPRRLIGRGAECERIRERLAAGDVVALIGAPGVGKTRLAIAVADEARADFDDGVWFVDLAPLERDAAPGAIADALAGAMALAAPASADVFDALANALRERRVLVVLDNAEHVRAGACAFVDELRTRALPTGVLLTSRVALHLADAAVEAVTPLGVPPLAATRAADVATFPAVELFVARALDEQPTFRLADETAATIAGIVRDLDGVPLAIELAVARLNVLGPAELGARLVDRLRLLRRRDGARRHRTLEALLDWSVSLLEPHEARAFDRLAIFAGGWTLAAARAVCFDAGTDEVDALDVLSVLVDASLVVADHGPGPTRFRFLETTHAYAAQRLDRSGERDRLAERHARHVLAFARDYFVRIGSMSSGPWLAEQLAESDNIRAALAWTAAAPERAELGARLAAALPFYWTRRFFDVPAALATIERSYALVAAGPQLEPALLADLAHAAAQLFLQVGRRERAEPFARTALDGYRALGDDVGTARALALIGHATIVSDRDGAEAALLEARAVARRVDEARVVALAGRGLARLAAERDDDASAEALLRETAAVYRRLQDDVGAALVTGALADLALSHGDTAGALAQARAAVALLDGSRAYFELGWALLNLATIEVSGGSASEARRCARRALGLLAMGGHETFQRDCFVTLSRAALREGDALHATALLAYAARDDGGAPSSTALARRRYDDHAAQLRALAGERFAWHWNEGRSWSPAEALRAAGDG